MIKKKAKPKRYLQLLDDKCPQCGHRLAIWVNHGKNEKFISCSNFPICKHAERKGLFEFIRDELEIPLIWRPKFTRAVEAIMNDCQSRKERQYLLGAVFFIDATENGKSKNAEISSSRIMYEGISYYGLIFERIYQYWNMSGYYSPTSLAIVPQLGFGNKLHHDFGIFFSNEKYPKENDWVFELAVEIDYHPSHEWNPGIDKFRDSLVKYKILRILRETEPIKWFSKVQHEIGGKIFELID